MNSPRRKNAISSSVEKRRLPSTSKVPTEYWGPSSTSRWRTALPAALSAIEAETLLMPCMTDLYFRTADNEAELQHLRKGRLVEIPSYWGHMSGAGQNEADTLFIDENLKALLAA